MIVNKNPKNWKDLENKVCEILEKCGFSVERQKNIETVRGNVEVDVFAKEIIDKREYSIICECKHWKSGINKNVIHGFRTVINGYGCNKGYIITTSNFQRGAFSASEKTNISLLNWDEFQYEFFESWYTNYFSKKLSKALFIQEDYNIVSWFEDLNKEDRKLYHHLKNNLHEIAKVESYLTQPVSEKKILSGDFVIPRLPLKSNFFNMSNYFGELPQHILEENNYQIFLDEFISHAKSYIDPFLALGSKYKQD